MRREADRRRQFSSSPPWEQGGVRDEVSATTAFLFCCSPALQRWERR